MRFSERGQSLVEFALMVPLLVLFILGAAEITLFIGAYINVIDLTREAARFASVRDPTKAGTEKNCGPATAANPTHPLAYDNSFFYDTACIFSPIQGSSCTGPADPFCNGFNSTLFFKPDEDDIVVNVFTVTDNQVSSYTGPWAWSNYLDTEHDINWQKNCDGSPITPTPTAYFDRNRINHYLEQNQETVRDKGFVTVEAYYCYHQVLNVPLIGLLFPNPMRIHVYTVMPLPAAAPPPVYPTPTTLIIDKVSFFG